MPAKLTTPARAVPKASVTPKPAEGGTRKAAVVTPKNTAVKGDGFVGGVGKALVTGLEQLNRSGHQLLRRAGYDLPLLNNEGKTTPESVEVLKKFQADHKLPTTGEFDTATVAALKKAKPPAKVQYPEYDKMFKDGVLSTTLAIGYDEGGSDIRQRKDIVNGLLSRGFTNFDVSKLTDAELKGRGFDPKKIDRSACYYLRSFEHNGKPVQSLIKLVDRNVTDPKAQFGNGMAKDDLVIYSGHARYGWGPDFDDIKSDKQNYVVGKPYEQGHVQIGQNDLKRTKLSDGYQLMFFDGCTTRHYLDDLRAIPKNKSAQNLDIVASNKVLSWGTSNHDVFAMLDGVMARQSLQTIKGKLDTANAKAEGQGDAFVADGFKANTYRPAAP